MEAIEEVEVRIDWSSTMRGRMRRKDLSEERVIHKFFSNALIGLANTGLGLRNPGVTCQGAMQGRGGMLGALA